MSARLLWIDHARTVALVGMVAFHFVFDFSNFAILPVGLARTPFWWTFARVVASSFIFIAGVSLFLAHGRAWQPRKFLRRLAVLVAAAAGVSGATYLADPAGFVYFGILHSIAMSSVIGLAFLRAPAAVTLAAALGAAVLPRYLVGGIFDHPLLVWTGLATQNPPSMDYVPTFPWLAPFLAGLAFAQATRGTGLWRGATADPGPLARALAWPGRHSLSLYLLHQPILFGLAYLIASRS